MPERQQGRANCCCSVELVWPRITLAHRLLVVPHKLTHPCRTLRLSCDRSTCSYMNISGLYLPHPTPTCHGLASAVFFCFPLSPAAT